MSYGIYVGRNLTSDGIAYLAGYGDEPSSHYLEIAPRQTHQPDTAITVGMTVEADLPGQLSQIPQAAETARCLRVNYSYYKGVPAPLTNGGLNEYGVAVRDIWSTSRDELIAMTPQDQRGPNYSDLARIIIQRAKTARQGVELISELIADYGYSTYGGNSHLIADPDEAWVVIECAGGKGLWVAERLGPDAIRASRPGYIGEIPIDDLMHEDFVYAPNLISFAVEQGWYDPASDTAFNFNTVYGDGKGRWAGVQWIEDEMTTRARRPEKIGLEDVIWAIRTEKLTGDTAGYGQVVPLTHPKHDGLRMMWHAPVGALAAPLVPVFIGMSEVPEEFRQHRYLTTGESALFEDARKATADEDTTVSVVPQGVESTRSAVAVFKRLMYLVLQHQDPFLPEVTAAWEGLERRLIADLPQILKTAEILYDAGEAELAASHLTYYARTELLNGLDLGDTLAQSLEARTRVLFGFSADAAPISADQIW